MSKSKILLLVLKGIMLLIFVGFFGFSYFNGDTNGEIFYGVLAILQAIYTFTEKGE